MAFVYQHVWGRVLIGHELARLKDESNENKDVEIIKCVGILGEIELGAKIFRMRWL